jgi:DNA-binding CsgD family transcriptional regulator
LSLNDDLSEFIGRIYESAFDADAWDRVIKELMSRTGSRIAFLSSVDLRHGEFNRALFYGPEESMVEVGMREYAEETYVIDPTLAWATKHPSAGMCETTSILTQSDLQAHPFFKWQLDRLGTTHFRVIYNQPVDDVSFALSLHPATADGPPSKELRSLHKMLFCHIERALRLAARPPDFSRDGGAVVALDRYGRVVACSPRAEQLLALADGLQIEDRQIVATNPESTNLLNQTIQSAMDAHSEGGAGGGVRIKRNSGRPHWLALTSPYPRFLEHLPLPTPAVVVRILETEVHPILLGKHADLFRLTHREIEVGCELLEGHSIESLAVHLGISRNTARVHLQSLFRKTETNRQSDLIRVFSEIARH